MKKYLKIILPVIILGLGLVFWKIKYSSPVNSSGTGSREQFANLKISTGNSTQSIGVSAFVGKTALEATEAKAKVLANGTGTNAFVTSINGTKADPGKREFWEFDVNGVESQVGAGTYIIKNHDEIEWKISNY